MEYQPVDTVDCKAEDLNLNCLLLAHLRKVAFFLLLQNPKLRVEALKSNLDMLLQIFNV